MRLLMLGLILLTLNSCSVLSKTSCEREPLPEIEWCIVSGDGSLRCQFPNAQIKFDRSAKDSKGYLCSNPTMMGQLILACKK